MLLLPAVRLAHISLQCLVSNRCVKEAASIAIERLISIGRIVVSGIKKERLSPGRRIAAASRVEKERSTAGGRVVFALGVAKKSARTIGGVGISGGVILERTSAGGSVIESIVVKEGELTIGRVSLTIGVS